MNFFEGQFRKMLWGNDMIRTPFYVDGACFGTLGRDHLVQMQFLASKNGYLFDVLEIVVVRRVGDQQNTFNLQLKDILGGKVIFSGAPREAASHWFDVDHWIKYDFTWEDWHRLQDAVKDCLDSFCKPEVPSAPSHRLVYLCAPLRGDVERNIEFARRRAREVFQGGEVPICPHLMFPPIADPGNESENQAARDMGLRLVALCQQVNVYGGTHTAGMREEIELAERLGIPVKYVETEGKDNAE